MTFSSSPIRRWWVFAGVTKVFAIAEGKAIEHRIEPGRRVDGRVEVLGLATSVERVVVSGGSRLATGTPVREATSDAQVGARNETLSADGPSPAGAVALPRTPRPREPDPVSQTPWPDPVSLTGSRLTVRSPLRISTARPSRRSSIVTQPAFKIARCTFDDPRVLGQVHEIQQSAYAVEAALIGCWEIPGLREPLDELRASAETFWGCFISAAGEVGSACAGVVATEPESGEAGTVRISRLAVDPAHFREGVGRRLVHHVIATAQIAAAGHTTVVVSTGAANTPARALYEAAGFVLTRWSATPDGTTRLVEYRWLLR